jgi:hypothetical protein
MSRSPTPPAPSRAWARYAHWFPEGTGLAAPVRDYIADVVHEFSITTEAIRADRRLSAIGRAEALRAAEAAAEARLAELGNR